MKGESKRKKMKGRKRDEEGEIKRNEGRERDG